MRRNGSDILRIVVDTARDDDGYYFSKDGGEYVGPFLTEEDRDRESSHAPGDPSHGRGDRPPAPAGGERGILGDRGRRGVRRVGSHPAACGADQGGGADARSRCTMSRYGAAELVRSRNACTRSRASARFPATSAARIVALHASPTSALVTS